MNNLSASCNHKNSNMNLLMTFDCLCLKNPKLKFIFSIDLF